MYVKDGIAYSDNQEYLPRVQSVKALEDYHLFMRFTDGAERIYDVQPLLSSEAFSPLSDVETFNSVYVDYGCPVWNNGEIDLAPETIYQEGVQER